MSLTFFFSVERRFQLPGNILRLKPRTSQTHALHGVSRYLRLEYITGLHSVHRNIDHISTCFLHGLCIVITYILGRGLYNFKLSFPAGTSTLSLIWLININNITIFNLNIKVTYVMAWYAITPKFIDTYINLISTQRSLELCWDYTFPCIAMSKFANHISHHFWFWWKHLLHLEI